MADPARPCPICQKSLAEHTTAQLEACVAQKAEQAPRRARLIERLTDG